MDTVETSGSADGADVREMKEVSINKKEKYEVEKSEEVMYLLTHPWLS